MMVMAKTESKAEYFDINAQDFGADFVALCAENRELYQMQKDIAKRMAKMLGERINPNALPMGYTISGVAWTRWGQMQAVARIDEAKISTAKPRKTLSAWQADQEANGDRA